MRHSIHGASHHWAWDNALKPALAVAPGDTVEIETLDPGGGQIRPDSTAADVAALDFRRVNPATGPIFIEGVEAGDLVRVTLMEIAPCGWGWSALIPGFGLLAEDFPDPALHLWDYDAGARTPALYGPKARVPLKPMLGCAGLAPGRPGAHDILPPRRVGGTMDIRDLATGTELLLPAEVPGGLLSCGDGHAAQGDGEVCGTGIETALKLVLRIEVEKGAAPASPVLLTPGPVARHFDAKGYEITTGIGPSLMAGAVDAVRRMIDLLGRRHGLSPEDAYILCSVCADLRISQIVDRPNWIVSLYFPRLVFD